MKENVIPLIPVCGSAFLLEFFALCGHRVLVHLPRDGLLCRPHCTQHNLLLLLPAFPTVSLGLTILLLLRSQLYLWCSLFLFFFLRSLLYLWGSPFFFFFVHSYISGVHYSSSSSAFPAVSVGFTILLFLRCVHSYISGVQYSSSSAFPAISLGFTILGEIFAYVTVFFLFLCVCVCVCLFVCNPTIEAVTFRLCGWCVLGVLLAPAFTRLGHEWQFFEFVRWNACVHRLDGLSSERGLEEWSQNPC